MHRLKDIARRMDNCHERTAKRWWKKLGVKPDVDGHGAHRWKDKTADRLIALWEKVKSTRARDKYLTAKPSQRKNFLNRAGDADQFKFNFNATQKIIAQKISVAKKIVARHSAAARAKRKR
jgi:hypothetical protein